MYNKFEETHKINDNRIVLFIKSHLGRGSFGHGSVESRRATYELHGVAANG